MEDYIMYFFGRAIPLTAWAGGDVLYITEKKYEKMFIDLAKVWANVSEVESYEITISGLGRFNDVMLDIKINGVKVGMSEAIIAY